MGFKPLPAAIAALITLVIWFFIPIPAGVTPQAWHLLALFIGVIAAIIGKAMPIGAIAFIAILLVAITGVTADKPGAAIQDALSVNDTLKLSHLPRSMFKKRGVKVSHC